VPTTPSIQQDLIARYGLLLTSEEVARLLRFKSKEALMKARRRHVLPIELFSIAGRRGLFAKATELATWVENLESSSESQALADKGRSAQ